ncbi:MAG: hypothetical protein ACI8TQ_002207 [Planctomycetota bacterium]|jgi:hypothetical protein
MRRAPFALSCVLALAAFSSLPAAQRATFTDPGETTILEQNADGSLTAVDDTGVYIFSSHREYVLSEFFARNDKRCGSLERIPFEGGIIESTVDCSSTFTNPAAQYDPSGNSYDIAVVVHILQAKNGSGAISDALVHSQIDVLNEDFLALAGSLGAPGNDANIQFHLATVDPSGNPTTGITRSSNNRWYNDQGNYASALNWDTTRYLNIYTNLASGNLGYAYVPNSGGVVGTSFDGVRIYWPAFGRNAPIGSPYNLGRTATHEVGHYLGLYHTFDGGCASVAGCAGNGDLVCDTNPESTYTPSGTCSKTTCGSPDPTDNYMDYSDDICMSQFTPIQANRMRCTVESFRPGLIQVSNSSPVVNISAPSNGTSVADGVAITFTASANDAEDGSLTSSITWSSNLDGALGSGGSISATLSVGSHTITASATDTGGATGNDSVNVSVTGVGGGISLLGNLFKNKGKISANLSWSSATGSNVDIYRDGAFLTTTANDGSYTDATGRKGSATFTYQVCETGGGACSNVITISI